MRVSHEEKRDVTTGRSGRDPKGGGLCKKTKRRSRPQGRSGPQRGGLCKRPIEAKTKKVVFTKGGPEKVLREQKGDLEEL